MLSRGRLWAGILKVLFTYNSIIIILKSQLGSVIQMRSLGGRRWTAVQNLFAQLHISKYTLMVHFRHPLTQTELINLNITKHCCCLLTCLKQVNFFFPKERADNTWFMGLCFIAKMILKGSNQVVRLDWKNLFSASPVTHQSKINISQTES